MKKFLLFIVAAMAAAMGYAQNNAPLCFTARNDSVTVRFLIKYVSHTIQYSTDGTTWNNYTSNSNVAIAADQSVYFRAATNQTTAFAFSYEGGFQSRFYFTSSNGGMVEASGNIMSLYGPDCPDLPLQDFAFYGMFAECSILTAAPSLPASSLAEYCYREMFDGCSSLTTAPALPAVNLANCCYLGMFGGCSSLSAAPSLPATSLFAYCYYYMFNGCSSLTTVPSLPATTLANNCYTGMFNYCTSLVIDTAAPGKPWMISATSVTGWDLTDMFLGTSGTMNGTPHANTTYYIASAPKYSVTVNVNDSTMGSVTGAGMYYIGDTATLTATPNAGYEFDCWSNGEKSQTISIVVVSDTVMSASFKIKTGVEDLQNNEFVVYSEKSNIVVTGAMNKKVSVYDLNGRLVAETPNANETHEFAVAMTGIYMVCIDDRNAVKVIVE